MKIISTFTAIALMAFSSPALARRHDQQLTGGGLGLANATVLVIRHAEKPDVGTGLTQEGEARARAYVNYFQNLRVDGAPIRIDSLIATADSNDSQRPRLTLEPLSRAIGLPVQQPFEDRAVQELASWLRQGAPNRTVLIAWHHAKLPKLISALGVDPAEVLPGGVWPSSVFDWVVVLRFDPNGQVIPKETRLVKEPSILR